MEARRTGAAPMDSVTGTPVNTDTALTTAIPIKTHQALFKREENTVVDMLPHANTC